MAEQELTKEIVGRHQNLMDLIVSETFVRHAKMTEAEFLKEIGFENSDKTEQEAVNVAMFNLLVEITETLLKAKEQFNQTASLLKLYCKKEEK